MDELHVEVFERCLAALSVSGVERGGDGDWVIGLGSRRLLARIFHEPTTYCYIWTGVCRDLDPRCLEEVNRFNSGSVIARLVYTREDGALYAGADLAFAGLNPKSLEVTLQAVESVARGVEPLFKAMYSTDVA